MYVDVIIVSRRDNRLHAQRLPRSIEPEERIP